MDENPTLEEITSGELENLPMDSPRDLLAVAKKRFRLEAMRNRITAARQDDFPRVKHYNGRAEGLVEAVEILDDVFIAWGEDEDDDTTIGGEDADTGGQRDQGAEDDDQGIY